MQKVLVTGAAGFIGYHYSKVLLSSGYEVYGIDNINDYYLQKLKFDRLKDLGIAADSNHPFYTESQGVANFRFMRINLEDRKELHELFRKEQFNYVVNLAAQAGVRYSIENPYTYIDSNIVGFINILEGCRHFGVKHLLYASSSSVYGLNKKMPFSVEHNVDHPISLYAASKKANELMAHTYSYLYSLPTTGLRFFTVYGPFGRPDMALFIFTKAIMEGRPIEVYNNGEMQRDFTYVADIVESMRRLLPIIPKADENYTGTDINPSKSPAPYSIYNIGNNAPVKLLDFVSAIEKATGKEATKIFKPLQPGDVPSTYADVKSLFETINFQPKTSIQDGINSFVSWYRGYFS